VTLAKLVRVTNDAWEHGLLTGNGRQGAAFHVGAGELLLTLSHERLFLPVTPPVPPPPTAAILPELRGMLHAERYREAAERVVAHAARTHPAYAQLRWIDPLVPAATVRLRPAGGLPEPLTAGPRWGVPHVTWAGGWAAAYASRRFDLVTAGLCAGTEWTVTLGMPDDLPPNALPVPAEVTTAVEGGDRVLDVRFPEAGPRQVRGYRVRCRVVPTRDALVVLLRTTVHTPGPGGAAHGRGDGCAAAMDEAARWLGGAVPYRGVRAHDTVTRRTGPAGDTAAWYGPEPSPHEPMAVDLGADPTDRRAGTADLLARPFGPALAERLFTAAGRLVADSCGDLPPTLQGVWSGSYDPPWRSGWTVDGNLQAAVAALLPTNRGSHLRAVFDLLDPLLPDFRENAKALYGCAGILVPGHIGTHGLHNHFGPVWCQTFWTAGAAWLARLYHDYWDYTGDVAFLRGRALPFLREAAAFHLDFVSLDSTGRAVFAPSYSPENAPANTGSQACVSATMDVAAVGDLLRNLLRLDPDHPAAHRWRALHDALPPYRIAPDGELAEWIPAHLAEQHAHRHSSHLYPLWYEVDPSIARNPALRHAAENAVRKRLAWWRDGNADEMAYGLAQLGLAAARLGLAAEAYECLTLMVPYWRPNLTPTHNLGRMFNVDIAGGLPAVLAAMLLRDTRERVDVLPALPDAWPRGRARFLRARGGLLVRELCWSAREITAVLVAEWDRPVVIGWPDGTADAHRLRSGVPLRVTHPVDS
jgi:alpha-L-fucosidase 2